MSSNQLHNLLCAGTALLVLASAGCSKKTPEQSDKAEKILEQFLDAWSRGDPADKFAEAGGAIQGSDPDWKSGSRLASFLCVESKQVPDKPDLVRCKVSLSLLDRQGRQREKQVVYEVQMGDNSVIRRAEP